MPNYIYIADNDPAKGPMKGGSIYKAYTDIGGIVGEALVIDQGEIRGLAVDLHAGKIFWTQNYNTIICHTNISGDDTIWAFELPKGDLGQIDVDPNTGNLYFIQNNNIVRMMNDGTGYKVIASSEVPGDIAVDSALGRVYWVDEKTKEVYAFDIGSPDKVHKVFSFKDEFPDGFTSIDFAPMGQYLYTNISPGALGIVLFSPLEGVSSGQVFDTDAATINYGDIGDIAANARSHEIFILDVTNKRVRRLNYHSDYKMFYYKGSNAYLGVTSKLGGSFTDITFPGDLKKPVAITLGRTTHNPSWVGNAFRGEKKEKETFMLYPKDAANIIEKYLTQSISDDDKKTIVGSTPVVDFVNQYGAGALKSDIKTLASDLYKNNAYKIVLFNSWGPYHDLIKQHQSVIIKAIKDYPHPKISDENWGFTVVNPPADQDWKPADPGSIGK